MIMMMITIHALIYYDGKDDDDDDGDTEYIE